MVKVIIQPSAERNLEEIGDYIANDNPLRAVSFIEELRSVCKGLEAFPKRYPIDHEAGNERRLMPYRGYRVFYEYDERQDIVYVLCIMEGHKDY